MPKHNARERYLTAAEAGGVPWIEPGLFDAKRQPVRFDPADYDGFEIEPCSTWADATGRLSTERTSDAEDGAPVSMWSLYLHRVAGGVECVADLPSEAACIALAAAVSATYGIEPGKDSGIELALIASGAARYVIEPQRDYMKGVREPGDNETEFGPCRDAEAEDWAVLRYRPGAPRGDAEGVEAFPSRREAVAFILQTREG